jgi:hypothetical protein
MPVKVEVPTRSKVSRVAEDNSAMDTSHPPARLSDLKAGEQEAARNLPDPCKSGQNRAKHRFGAEI